MSPHIASRTALREQQRAGSGIDHPGLAAVQQRANENLEALVIERTGALMESQRLLHTTLQHMDQGLVFLDHSQTVRLCNPRALELLRLPANVLHENAAFEDIRKFQNARGDFSLVSPSTFRIISGNDARRFPLVYDWPRPDGRTLEVRRVQLPDGCSVNTFTDITERRAAEQAVLKSERLHRRLAERVEQLAQTDELTGLLNRRYIIRALNDATTRARRSAEPCSVAIIDLDFFKRINDRFGHPTGDEVLRSFAIAVSANVRSIDQVGRYGGEEFLLVLPRASEQQASDAVNRLREIVAELDWTAISDSLSLTISAGVAQIRIDEAPDDILARADAALYRAKDAGRNCVVCA
jgi:diguanylate cyclase (GGDEF)-like protein